MGKPELTEIEKLKYWIDIEFTVLHIMFAIILGVIVGGIIWWFVGAYIFISVVYIIKRARVMPQDYLKVKK